MYEFTYTQLSAETLSKATQILNADRSYTSESLKLIHVSHTFTKTNCLYDDVCLREATADEFYNDESITNNRDNHFMNRD